jgi:hypothetical protein
MRQVVLLFCCATSTKDEQLAVVIPSDITNSDHRSAKLAFAEERPLWRQRIPGACNKIKSGTDLGEVGQARG